MMSHLAIERARRYHHALEELFSKSASGWSSYHTMSEVNRLCAAAWAEVEDNHCREQLDLIELYARDLFSEAGQPKGSAAQLAKFDTLSAKIHGCLRVFENRILSFASPSRPPTPDRVA